MEAPPDPLMPGARPWPSERIERDGDRYLAGVLADLAAARRTARVELYLVEPGTMASALAEGLAAAAARGVDARLLVDGVGAYRWISREAAALARRGVRVAVYHPTPLQALSLLSQRLTRRWSWVRSINRRDHRKIVAIDGGIAWVGSFNAEDALLPSRRGASAWRDCAARVEGPAVALLEEAFDHACRRAWPVRGTLRLPQLSLLRRHRPPLDPSLVRLNDSLRRRRLGRRLLLRRIAAARERVWGATPYFLPARSLRLALGRAARRGVDVRMLVPGPIDHAFLRWFAAPYQRRLLREGVRFAEYRPAVMHAKIWVIDAVGIVGSCNLNQRSWLHDLEAEVILRSPAAVSELADGHAADWAQADPLDLAALAARPWWQRWIASVFFGLRWWM